MPPLSSIPPGLLPCLLALGSIILGCSVALYVMSGRAAPLDAPDAPDDPATELAAARRVLASVRARSEDLRRRLLASIRARDEADARTRAAEAALEEERRISAGLRSALSRLRAERSPVPVTPVHPAPPPAR